MEPTEHIHQFTRGGAASRFVCNPFHTDAPLAADPVRHELGEHAANRLASFRNYPDGWDNGRGHRLSANSESRLVEFLASGPGFATQPSLFLTRTGNLQLVWRDQHDGAVEVEFFEDHIEFFSEAIDSEGTASYAGLPDFVAQFK